MVPFFALIVSFLLFWVFGLFGWRYFEGWHTPLQGAVVVMLLLAASAHWGKRRPDLIRMVPSAFPKPDWIVTATGVAGNCRSRRHPIPRNLSHGFYLLGGAAGGHVPRQCAGSSRKIADRWETNT